ADAVDVRIFRPDRSLLFAGELVAGEGWQEVVLLPAEPHRQLEASKQTGYGTGLVRITRVQFLDRDGREVVEIRHVDPFIGRVGLAVSPDLATRNATFVLGFARHESPYSAYVYEPQIVLPSGVDASIEVCLDKVLLGSGQWYVSLGVGEFG